MRVPLAALLLVLAFAPTSARKIPACISSPPDAYALTALAESGEPKAQLTLGQYYYDTKDPEKLPLSAYWFTKSAEQGDADAEWRLAGLFGAGEGVTQDNRSALYWIEKAAEDGQVQAQWTLGMNYRDGRDVGRDQRRAFDWFMRAAKQGDVDSQVSVAQVYEEGDVVPQDYMLAATWYKKAAEHVPDWGGARVARNSLGLLYMDGRGVPRDYATAYMYFALSNSEKNMQWAAERMTSSQIAEAQTKGQRMDTETPTTPGLRRFEVVTRITSAAE